MPNTQKQDKKTNQLPLDTSEATPLFRIGYIYDESGERVKRHANIQTLTKDLYNQGAREINNNKDLFNIYHSLPLHKGKRGSQYSINELQGIFAIYVALERLGPNKILQTYRELGEETTLITIGGGIKLPNGTRFGIEIALCSILYFYITKFNPNKFDKSAVTKIEMGNNISTSGNDSDSRRCIELAMLNDMIIINKKDDTQMVDLFLDKAKQKRLYRLINNSMRNITNTKPECSKLAPLKFFKEPIDDVATSSEVVSQSNASCYVM